MRLVRGAGVAAVIDDVPTDSDGPIVRHLGPDLGADVDLAGAAPRVRWGARMDGPTAPRSADGPIAARAADGLIELSARGALSLPAPAGLSDVLTTTGDWANEFAWRRASIDAGAVLRESLRGRPGHDSYPALILCEPSTGETQGRALALILAHGGGHAMRVERTREGAILASLEARDAETTRVVAAWSDRGLNALSHALRGARAPRGSGLVHLNTWEAVYFDHDTAKLAALADAAAEIGVERFVLDDGWFEGRDDDTSSLGDWTPDARKYPRGLKPLADAVRAKGMDFGLWVEPEMVNARSALYAAHPDWILRRGESDPPTMRNQLVLDVRRDDVRAYLVETIAARVAESGATYLKWDMNRDLPFDAAGFFGSVVSMMAGIARETGVEIEACASGGGRCDWATMEVCARAWISDSNDALDRVRINRGASYVLPLKAMGTHVGPEVCHITGRRLGLDLRAHVALFGWFGVEADITRWTAEERARLAAHIANYKRLRGLIHDGHYWRLETHEPDHLCDAVTADDRSRALLRVVRVGSQRLGQGVTARLEGLDDDARYRIACLRPVETSVESGLAPAIRDGSLELTGRTFRARGLDLWLPRPETSLVLEIART